MKARDCGAHVSGPPQALQPCPAPVLPSPPPPPTPRLPVNTGPVPHG